MAAYRYEQIEAEGVRISEVWGLPIHEDEPDRAHKEWIKRHDEHATASGLGWQRLTVDPQDANHLLHEAWPSRPDDEGPPRWFGGAW
jgi:hypothetical protein